MTEPARRPRDLSTLLQRSILLAALLAMVLFALPLAVAVRGLYRSQSFAELARMAERVKADVVEQGSGASTVRFRITVPADSERDVRVGVYFRNGLKVSGAGPARSGGLLREVGADGVEGSGVEDGELVVAVPILVDEGGRPATGGADDRRYVVRVAESQGSLSAKIYLTWLGMAGLAGAVLLVIGTVGRTRARRLAQPLTELATAAEALGRGDFSVRAIRAGVSEIDDVSGNLERTARRLGAILERERAFTAEASHQLRTPLTAMRLSLESALVTPGSDLGAAVDDALAGLDRLEQTVLDLLMLARDTSSSGQQSDVAEVLDAVLPSWRRPLAGQGRRLEVISPAGPLPARIAAPALRTVLDVLLGNALSHGAGTVLVEARHTPDAVLVEVSDEGPGITGDPRRVFTRRSSDARGTGIGLALARSLVEADGARLELVRAVPPTFGILLPVADEPTDPDYPAEELVEAAPRSGGSKR
jgi:signal transduction histidine kinase